MKKYIPLKERTLENDIKYKAPLSYRYLRIIAWFFMGLAQLVIVFKIGSRLDAGLAKGFEPWITAFSYFSDLPLPLFLLANLALILQRKNEFKKQFIKFGSLAALFYILANVIVLHYMFETVHRLAPSIGFIAFSQGISSLLCALGRVGYSLNIFIDLLLFVLTIFFLHYKPKKVFTGKKLYIFRSFVILPFLYEIGSLVIKALLADGKIKIITPFFFLLTSKPVYLFLAFFVLLLLMKLREFKHLKKHESEKLLSEHYKTNAHSLRVSITISVILFICFFLDLITVLVIATFYAAIHPEFAQLGLYEIGIQYAQAIGFGWGSTILLIPIILLFSYTKKHKDPNVDLLVPLAGVGFIAIIYVEGLYQVTSYSLIETIHKLKDLLVKIIDGSGEEGSSETPPPEAAVRLITSVKNLFIR